MVEQLGQNEYGETNVMCPCETGPDQLMGKRDKMSMYTDNGKTLFLCPCETGPHQWQNS